MDKKNLKLEREILKKRNEALKAKRKRVRNNFIILGLILFSLVGIMYLLKQSSDNDFGKRDSRRAKREKRIPLEIKKVQIEPAKPRSCDVIRAIPVMNRPTRGKVTYFYRWFLNGKEIFNLNESILPEAYRRKNNRLYCITKAVEGKFESPEKKSKEFVIANSPPVLGYQKIEKFQVPGTFHHQVIASDPDGDALQYQLVAPVDRGATIDPQTGEINWPIAGIPQMDANMNYKDEAPSAVISVPDPKKSLVEFIIKAIDADGDFAITSFRLDLTTGSRATH